MPEQDEFLRFALDLAVAGGEITLRYFHKDLEIEVKSDASPVTVADRETEAVIFEMIRGRYPSHGIIGEEQGSFGDDRDFCWVVDPIDGTKSFVAGVPLYTVLIALLFKGEPILGVIHQPVMRETVWAAVGQGCFFNGKKTQLRPCAQLSEAWLLTTDPTDLLNRWKGSAELLQAARYTRTWGDGYGYLMLASGRADLMIDAKMNLWDVACLQPIVTEAGGYLCDLTGKTGLGDSSIAGREDLVVEALRFLNDR